MTVKKILTVFLLVLMMSALLATTVSAAEEAGGLTLPSGEEITLDTLTTGNLGSTFFPMMIAVAAVGLLEAFFGYTLLRLELTLGGFAGGYFLGSFLVNGVLRSVIPEGTVSYIPMLVLGLIGALLAFKLFKLALFLGVGAAGFLVARSVIATFPLNWPVDLIVAIAVGLVLGILALKLMRPIVILVTALMGGYLVSFAFSGLLPIPYANLILLAVVFLLGVLIQGRRARKSR